MPAPEPECPPGELARPLDGVEQQEEDPGEEQERSLGGAQSTNKQERSQTREEFQLKIRRALKEGGLPLRGVGRLLLDALPLLGTKFGKFRSLMEEEAVEKVKASGPAAHDLLPISVEAVEEADFFEDSGIRGWAAWCCLCLNFWYCTGWERASHLEHPRELIGSQKDFLVCHLTPALQRMLEGEPIVPSMRDLEKTLAAKGQDYEGNTWVVMEQLEAEKVVACWPEAGKAAVQPLVNFLQGETKTLIETPQMTILPHDEWPEEIPRSYVRATDDEWEALVKEGFKRGLFRHCPAEEVLTGPDGKKILNGAGAVPKEKNGKILQRFISIFCPLNAVSRKVEGEESTLPYVGQVCLLNVPEESTILVDSEDLQSAFNLFEMPIGWRGLFCYEKQVRGDLLGLATTEPVFVSLRTVPMGWISAVGVVQAAIRHLAFNVAGLPLRGELQKWKGIPEGDKFLLYLDSVDQLRVVSKEMARILEGNASQEHLRFEAACREKGLPTNETKALAGALLGSIQGGDLRGDEGIFTLQIKKMQLNVALCLLLLGVQRWDQKRCSGVIGRLIFAGAFKRPILASLAEVFHHFQSAGERTPSNQAFDEVVGVIGLLPFAFTNIKAPVHSQLHATDASPYGAGSCMAKQIKREAGSSNPADITCHQCRREMPEEMGRGEEIDCPKKCGKHFCSLECYLQHRAGCPMKTLGVPLFSERWSGPNAPLTKAMLRKGFDVLPPYDMQREASMDYFTEIGKETWQELDDQDPDYEHEGPDCKTMSRARGKPFWLHGRKHAGPPALRDDKNIMGFKNLRGTDAVRVRQGNKMAITSLKRCKDLDRKGKFFSFEHPYRSFVWDFHLAVELASMPHVRMAIFSNCCHGGRRQKWTAVLTNCKAVYDALHRPDCPHGPGESYAPYEVNGRIIFPTEEEAEYPDGLCEAYAAGAATSIGLREHVQDMHLVSREEEIKDELAKYHKCQDEALRTKLAQAVLDLELRCYPGQEEKHLNWLLSQGHYRGTDIRLAIDHYGAKHLVPYPAHRWLWREVLSFPWKVDSHINVLEAQALFAHVRKVLRDPTMRSCRLMIVVDSQVLYYALGKGRSPSTQLNRVLRRLMALVIASDVMVFPIWTISSWNWADKPSRRVWPRCNLLVWNPAPSEPIAKRCSTFSGT